MMGNSWSDHAAIALIASALLILLGACSCDEVAAAPVLKVANRLDHGAALTVGCSMLPCAFSPRPLFCPGATCGRCEDVVVENGATEALPAWAPPPLPCLMVRVAKAVYCVERSGLELIRAWDTLAVGPGACGAGWEHPRGLAASIVVPGNIAPVAHLCLNVCSRG